jgi:hypothetical protein
MRGGFGYLVLSATTLRGYVVASSLGMLRAWQYYGKLVTWYALCMVVLWEIRAAGYRRGVVVWRAGALECYHICEV